MNFFGIKNPFRIRFQWAGPLSKIMFYAAFFLYIGTSMLRDTTIKYDHKPFYQFIEQFYWVAVCIALVNLVFLTDYTIGQLLVYAVMAAVFWISYRNCENYRLFHSFLIVLSCKNVRWKDLVRNLTVFYGLFLIGIFFTYCFDFTYGLDIYRRGSEIRWTLGFAHPNLVGGYLMVFVMLWLTGHYDTLNAFDVMLAGLVTVFTVVGPDSKTSALIMVLMTVMAVGAKLLGRYLIKSRLIRLCLLYVYPLCFLFIFFCSYFYSEDSAVFVKLDSIFSKRIQYGHMYLQKYYHSWFGQKISQTSNYTALKKKIPVMYLDSSYMRLYVAVGIVGCLLVLWIFTRIMRYAVEQQMWGVIAGLTAFAVYGISELYLTYIHWNFYMLLFAGLPVLRPADWDLRKKGKLQQLIFGKM